MFLVLQIKRINEYDIHFESEMIKATLKVAFTMLIYTFNSLSTPCINFLMRGEMMSSNAPKANPV